MRTISGTDIFFGLIIAILFAIMSLSLYQLVTRSDDTLACQARGYTKVIYFNEPYCVRVDQGDGEIVSLTKLEGSQ